MTTNIRIYDFTESLDHGTYIVKVDSDNCPVAKAREVAHKFLSNLAKDWGAIPRISDTATTTVGMFRFLDATTASWFGLLLESLKGWYISEEVENDKE